MLRLLAYMAGLAVLGFLGVIFFRLPDVVAAVAPAPRPQWIEVERPHPAFELVIPSLAGPRRATQSSAARPTARARTC